MVITLNKREQLINICFNTAFTCSVNACQSKQRLTKAHTSICVSMAMRCDKPSKNWSMHPHFTKPTVMEHKKSLPPLFEDLTSFQRLISGFSLSNISNGIV
jgi:hypothetical protein